MNREEHEELKRKIEKGELKIEVPMAGDEAIIVEMYSGNVHKPFTQETMFPHTEVCKEVPQCPRCELYTDDPEHWCGSVAVVELEDTPKFQRQLMLSIVELHTLLETYSPFGDWRR